MMRILAFVLSALISLPASAGAYEDLQEALLRNDSAAAINLISRGVDVNTVDRQGNTLLTESVRRDLPELFDFLLKHRARVNVRNKNAETALSIAAFMGREAYVKRLVEAGAEVNFFGWPPLSYAAFNGHEGIVDYLLKHGAEVNGKTENGSTALFFAARHGHLGVVRTLLKNGADPTVVNENDETAVDWAVKGKHTDSEDALRAAGGRSGKSVTIEMSK